MTTNHTPSPYLEHVTGIEGPHVGRCEMCDRNGLIRYTPFGEDDAAFICIPTTGCNDDADIRRAYASEAFPGLAR